MGSPFIYEDTLHCDHCDRDTPHRCMDGGHERDSSGDYRECLECGWYRMGGGEYEPPIRDDDEPGESESGGRR